MYKKNQILLFYFCLCTHSFMISSTTPPIPLSAFGEIRTVSPIPVFQALFTYCINSNYVTSTTANGATITQASSMAVLQTDTQASSLATLSSRTRLSYEPGQGSRVLFSALFTPGAASASSQIIGIGNSSDGFFFGYNGSTFGILHRNSSSGSLVNTWIPQASWNQDNCLGGGGSSNPSGMTLDQSKGNVFKIQYQYLGFGMIRFFLENPTVGAFILVHQIQYANINTTPSLSNPALQMMAQVDNGASTAAITLKTASLYSAVEGVVFSSQDSRNNAQGSNTAIGATNMTNVLTVLNNTTYQGKTNQTTMFPDSICLYNSTAGTGSAIFKLYVNPTIASGTFTYTAINTNTSVASYSATTTVNIDTSSQPLFTFVLNNGNAYAFDLDDFGLQLVPGDILVIACQSTTGTITARASLSWTESF